MTCYHQLFHPLMQRGYIPDRVGIQSMSSLGQGSQVFWDVTEQLKRSLDPQGILAPGRYQPTFFQQPHSANTFPFATGTAAINQPQSLRNED